MDTLTVGLALTWPVLFGSRSFKAFGLTSVDVTRKKINSRNTRSVIEDIDISLLSGGIYTAMITTVGGLIVGILAYFGYNYLTAQISNLMFKMETATIDFMDLLHEPADKEEEK